MGVPAWLLAACIVLLPWVLWARNRWRFRFIPGPFAPPIIGNLPHIGEDGLHAFLQRCAARYGSTFKIYLGSAMIIVLADGADARRVLGRELHRHSGVVLTTGKDDWDFLKDGLVGANGPLWHALRPAWASALHGAALASYAGAMNNGAAQLVTALSTAADSGGVVELQPLLGATTLSIVGAAAYGADLRMLVDERQDGHQQQQQTKGPMTSAISRDSPSTVSGGLLLAALDEVFSGGAVTYSSHYLVPILLFPALAPLLQRMAYWLPDARLRRVAAARKLIRQASMRLVAEWRQQQLQQQQEPLVAAAGSCRGTNPGIGAFPAAVMAVRSKDTGMPLTDDLVFAQLSAFVVAAFETTVSAATTSLLYVAAHPRVQARVAAELSALQGAGSTSTTSGSSGGGCSGWQLAASDLEQLPYLTAVVKESLRLLPPGFIITRLLQDPQHLTDQVVLPRGTPVFGCPLVCQCDPAQWPDALAFRPERWLPGGEALQSVAPEAFAPFGVGARSCVGQRFAMQEVIILLAHLFRAYEFLPAPGSLVPPRLRSTMALMPADGVRVTVSRRIECK